MSFELPDDVAEAFELLRRARADELRTLADVLVDADLAPDPSPLYSAAAMAAGSVRPTDVNAPDPGRWYWGYAIEDLQLKLSGDWKSVPKNSTFETSALTVTTHEYAPLTVDSVDIGYANLRIADVDFTLQGICDHGNGEIGTVHAAWHVDTHLYGEQTASAHPKHHFQFGGNKIESFEDGVRGLWVPDTPRLFSLPFDGILAVDFVLSHYAGADWLKVQEDSRYLTLRHASTTRYWLPMLETMTSFFGVARQQAVDHPALRLLPNLGWT